MIPLISALQAGARVLDVGARAGSFDSDRGDISTIRLDMEVPIERKAGAYVMADAARMPLHSGSFDLVISNHSLEHFLEVEAVLREIGRVLKPGGGLYVAVPDATTLTDRIYRWMARGGGHVNAFRSRADVIGVVERSTGLECHGGYLLYTSLSFLNRCNIKGWPGKKIVCFGLGSERYLAVFLWLLKRIDRTAGTRLAIYGWTFYFGSAEPEREEAWPNVCVRCGAGHPTEEAAKASRRLWWGPRAWRCQCGGWNLLAHL